MPQTIAGQIDRLMLFDTRGGLVLGEAGQSPQLGARLSER